MDSIQSVSLSPTQETPQAAAVEEDQDEVLSSKSTLKSSSSVVGDGNGSNSRSSSVTSFQSEEAFLSGDDDFETASERPYVAETEEDNLELGMDEGDLVVSGGAEVVGSSNFESLTPNSKVSGFCGENEVLDDRVGGVEVGNEGGVLGGKEEKLGGNSVVEGGIGDGVVEDSGIAVNDLSLIGNSNLAENPANGDLGLEENPVLDDKVPGDLAENEKEEGKTEFKDKDVDEKESEISSSELTQGKVIAVVEGSPAALAEKEDDILPESSKLGEAVDRAIGSQVEETSELKDVVVEEKRSEVLDSGLVEEKVIAVIEGSSGDLAKKEDDISPEDSQVREVVELANGGQEKETTELKEGVVEEKKTEVADVEVEVVGVTEGSIKPLPDKSKLDEVVVSAVNGSQKEETLALDDGVAEEEEKSKIVDTGVTALIKDKVPDVTETPVKLENSNVSEVVDPAIGSRAEETESRDVIVQEEKNENLDVEHAVTVIPTVGETSDVDTKQQNEASEHTVSRIEKVELPVENNAVQTSNNNQVTSSNNQVSTGVEDLISSEVTVADKEVSLTKGDSHVETEKQITSEVDANGVGEMQQNIPSKALESAIDGREDVGIVSDQAPAVVVESQGILVEADELNDSDIAESASVDPVKPEVENAREIDSLERAVPVFKLAGDGVEDKLDGLDQTPNTESEEPRAMQEDVAQVSATENNEPIVTAKSDESKDVISSTAGVPESLLLNSALDREVQEESEEGDLHSDYEEDEGSASDEDNEGLIFEGSEAAKQIMKELMQGSASSQGSQEGSQRIDGQIVPDSDEEVETDEDDDGKELFDSAALSALLKAATGGGSESGTVTITSPDGSRLFSVERPAGLGSSVRPLRPAPRQTRPNIFSQSDLTVGGVAESNLSEDEKKKLEKIQLIRVKYLRLIHRLGHSPDDSIAAQVLYRLVLAAGRNTSEAFSPETAKKTAMLLESEENNELDFSLNILVLGKVGVGKSATINSIFGEEKTRTDAFRPGTTSVNEIIGTVGGVKIRVIDTPGLRSSVMEQALNRKILSSVKKITKKCPPDILLYVDRLDTQTRDLNDLPMLKTITSTLGSSIWRSAIVTLTHGASAPPDGPSGNPLSYEVFVAQRSHVVQQSIGQAVGDLRMMNPSLMNPVTLVENHPSCRKNREGQSVLPNGQSWRPQLLLLSYSLKILSEVNSLSKPQDPFDHRKLFGFRVRAPPLPYLLSTLLQSRAHPKLPADQGGENVDSDVELEDMLDSDQEDEEDEYDQLPPFKPLRKAQLAKLSKEQRNAYFEEYDYRVKLLQKKHWKEELKRMKEMKNGKNDADYMGEEADPEGGAAAPVPVPLPDMVLPPSFDGDNPAYRYRFLEPTSQLLARPVLDTHGWDHDCGYDGVSLEENLAIVGRFPAGVAVQVTKDKKEFNIHLDSSVAAKHGENGSTLAGFDIQTVGKNLAYIVRGETKFKKLKRNTMTGGVAVTFLGESVATGLKVEDQVSVGKRITLVGSTGTVRSQGDSVYGANLEARLKDKDFPIGQDQSTLGLSLMKYRGDFALGANLQSQFSIGRSSKISVRAGLNNKLSGQITVRTSSSEQLQIALVALLPITLSIYRTIWPDTGESYSAY